MISTAWTRLRSVGRADLLMAVALLLASIAFVTEQVAEHEALSPSDEYVYIDYFAKVLDHGVVRQGEDSGQFARRYSACHGLRVYDSPPNEGICKLPHIEDQQSPLAGGTTADLYPPVYFAITRVLAQPFIWVGADLVSAGRLTGMYWLGAAGLVLYLALRRMRVPVAIAGGATLLMIGSPRAYWADTYISTDAPALLSGALALLLAVEGARRRRWALALLPLVAAVASLTKVQNLVAFVAAALFLLLASLGDRGSGESPRSVVRRVFDSRVLWGAGAVVAGVVAQGIWLMIRARIAVGPGAVHDEGKTFHLSYLWEEASKFLTYLDWSATDPGATGHVTYFVIMVTQLALIGGLVGLVVSRGISWTHRSLAWSVIAAAILAGPALTLSVVVTEGVYIYLPTRYGMSLLPWALACFALIVDDRSRLFRWGTLAVGIVTWCLGLTMFDAA